jgi:hypothetical protein
MLIGGVEVVPNRPGKRQHRLNFAIVGSDVPFSVAAESQRVMEDWLEAVRILLSLPLTPLLAPPLTPPLAPPLTPPLALPLTPLLAPPLTLLGARGVR